MVVALISVLVSGLLGLVTVWLALRKRSDEDSLARASRRTTALQLISDEEYALLRVRDECLLIQRMVAGGQHKLAGAYAHLASEADRIVGESNELLLAVRDKRNAVEPKIATLPAAEIESVIASAYHGKRLAEVQLERTSLSKQETMRTYGL